MDEVILTEKRKNRILKDFKNWSGGKSPWECSYEFEVQTYLDNCLYGEDNKDYIIISEWMKEICSEDY